MSDERQGVERSTEELLQALTKYGPEAIGVLNSMIGPSAAAQWEADRIYAPQYSQLQTDLYAQHAPKLGEVGREQSRLDQLAAAKAEADILSGSGQDLIRGAVEGQKQVDPNWYKTADLLSSNLEKYIGGMDPNALTDSERENVRRGLATTPGYQTPTALGTVSNAMTFGDALTAKRENFGRALDRATSALPTLKSGINAFEVATRRPLLSNTGQNNFLGAQQNLGSQGTQLGSNFLNQIAANQRVNLGQQKSLLENVTGWGEFGGKVIGSIGTGIGAI